VKQITSLKLLGLGVLLSMSQLAFAQSVTRHLPQSGAIAYAVEVPATATTVYLSGQIPDRINDQSYGTTEQQTLSVLGKIEARLKEMNLSMQDVVKMTVFLVGDPANNNAMDFAGFMKGYSQFFPNNSAYRPARSTMQVAQLVNPAWLVEIEVIAVRPGQTR